MHKYRMRRERKARKKYRANLLKCLLVPKEDESKQSAKKSKRRLRLIWKAILNNLPERRNQNNVVKS